MSTAREHAIIASELLDGVNRLQERARTMTPDEHLHATSR